MDWANTCWAGLTTCWRTEVGARSVAQVGPRAACWDALSPLRTMTNSTSGWRDVIASVGCVGCDVAASRAEDLIARPRPRVGLRPRVDLPLAFASGWAVLAISTSGVLIRGRSMGGASAVAGSEGAASTGAVWIEEVPTGAVLTEAVWT